MGNIIASAPFFAQIILPVLLCVVAYLWFSKKAKEDTDIMPTLYISKPAYIIYNPISGKKRSQKIANQLAATMFPFQTVPLTFDRVPLADAEFLFIVAGDGTLHNIVKRLIKENIFHNPTLIMIPEGTSNAVAKSLGIDSLSSVWKAAPFTWTREVAPMSIICDGDDKQYVHAILSVGLGVFANVDYYTDKKMRGWPLWMRQNLAPLIVMCLQQKFIKASLHMHEKNKLVRALEEEEFFLLYITTMPYVTSHLLAFKPKVGGGDDNKLHVLFVRKRDMPSRVALLKAFANCTCISELSFVHHYVCNQVEISDIDNGDGGAWSIDGEVQDKKDVQKIWVEREEKNTIKMACN